MTSHYITSPACSNSFLHFLQHHNEDIDEDNDDDDDDDVDVDDIDGLRENCNSCKIRATSERGR